MATQAEIDALRAREDPLYKRINELSEQLEAAREQLEKDEAIIRKLAGKTAADGLSPRGVELLAEAEARAPGLRQQINSLESQIAPLRAEVGPLSSQRVRLERELAATRQEPPPAQSASQQVATQTNQTPQPLPTANQPVDTADTGTDAPVKPVEETQAITTASDSGQALRPPSAGAGAEGTAGEAEAAAAVLQGGQGAKDDATPNQTPQSAVNANNTAEPRIRPRPNILDEFASYTYAASVYLITEEQYQRILTSENKTVDGYNLLFQSGGAANNRGGPREPGTAATAGPGAPDQSAAANDAGRNPFFDNDFYIDTITMETKPWGKGSGYVHNATSLKFTVVEPNGITLLDRLYDAVQNVEPKDASGRVNYTAVTYLMVIRFYGYDSMGQAVKIRDRRFDAEGTSDPAAVIEKFIPFRINNINWGVGSRMVTYEWDCTPIGQFVAGYSARGTVPYDVQLVESTVGSLLSGRPQFSTQTAPAANPGASTTATSSDPRQRRSQVRLAASQASAGIPPPKVNAAPSDKKSLTQGLADAMNQYQLELVQRGIYTYPDIYEIVFEGPGAEKIRDAALIQPGQNPIAQTASGKAATQDPNGLRPSTNTVDKTTKSFSITAGQQLIQVIDLVIRNSSYIYDQALVIVDQDGTVKPNPNSRNQPVKWFTVSMYAERASQDLDPKRNDYSYYIKYVVSPFIVKNLDSVYFPVPKFYGVHKSYPYWFTGQNTAVLDYNEKLNALYHLTISGEVPGNTNAQLLRDRYTSSLADIIKYAYSPRSGESSSGAQGKNFELAANASESLFSPSDIGESTIRIVGDPSWIQQGSIFRGPGENVLGIEAANTGFLPDGSISFDTQDVLYEVVWKRPNDYDIFTGKADPYARSASKYNNYSAEQSRVFYCKSVVSEFKQGRFEQTLTGALYSFPKPDLTNTANPAAAASANAVSDNRRPASVVLRANQTNQTAERLGLNLTAEAAAASRQAFAQVDPRRLDIGDGGAAAIQGAQALAKTMKAPATSKNNLTPAEISSTIQQATVPPVTLFSTPQPPTSGTGTPVQSVVFKTPNRLPSADPSVGRLTNSQIRDLVNQQSSDVNTGPTSPTNPGNQRGVRDF
jgi:hypothetical protein